MLCDTHHHIHRVVHAHVSKARQALAWLGRAVSLTYGCWHTRQKKKLKKSGFRALTEQADGEKVNDIIEVFND